MADDPVQQNDQLSPLRRAAGPGGDPSTQIGTGEGEVPLASEPPVNLDARTMASDIKSIQESGGSFPRPYTPSKPTTINTGENEQAASEAHREQARTDRVFTPPSPQAPSPGRPEVQPKISEPPQGPQVPQAPPQPVPSPKSGKRGLFIGIIVFLIVIGLAAVGYLFIYPLFWGEEATPAPTANVPGAGETVTLPAAPLVAPTSTEQPTSTLAEVPPPAPEPELGQHISPFKQVPDLKLEVSITSLTAPALHTVLQFDAVQTPVFREVVIKDSSDKLLTSRRLMSILAPQTFTSMTLDLFSLDPTVFVYSDSKGSWPGVLLTLDQGASVQNAKEGVSVIETGNEPANFFLSDPSIPQAWSNGKAGTLSFRFLSFESGSRFIYLWLPQNTLIMSASYDGLKAALNRL